MQKLQSSIDWRVEWQGRSFLRASSGGPTGHVNYVTMNTPIDPYDFDGLYRVT